MIIHIKNVFKLKNINNNNVFFGYIFDYSGVFDKEYDTMLNNCRKEGWKFCFFDSKKQIFCNKQNKEINDINKIFSCPFSYSGNKFFSKSFDNIFSPNLIHQNQNKLDSKELSLIKDLISKERNEKKNS